MPSLEKKSFDALAWFAPAILAVATGNFLSASLYTTPYPDPTAMSLPQDEAVQTSSLLSLGMRRLAADISFIQMIMYYGTPEENPPPAAEHGDIHEMFGRGSYPELPDRAIRIIETDPYFTYASLYAAGALAFNMDQPDNAIRVLNKAVEYDPKQWQFRAYTAAIGFSKQGNPEKVLHELSPVLLEPDCPIMLKSMLAYLNVKYGHRDEAVKIYKDMLQSRDHSYDHISRAMLHQLGAEGY